MAGEVALARRSGGSNTVSGKGSTDRKKRSRKECKQESVGQESRTEGGCKDGYQGEAMKGASHAKYAEESATKWYGGSGGVTRSRDCRCELCLILAKVSEAATD